MVDSEEKISFIPLVIGLILLGFIFYIVYAILIAPNPQYKLGFYIFLGLIAFSLAVIIYFCIKNPEFKEKTVNAVHVFTLGLSRIGDNIIKNYQEGDRKGKKKKQNVRIPPDIRKKVYERASYQCQLCTEKVSPEIHHIDGDPSHNSLNNLILLCPSDHAKADIGGIKKEQLKSALNKQTRTGKIAYVK